MRLVPLVLIAALLACACAEDTPPDIVVVIQETNVPDELGPCAEKPHQYMRSGDIVCDAWPETNIRICSDTPLCDAQVDDIVARVIACETSAGDYEDDLPGCP